jgi:serine protease Do
MLISIRFHSSLLALLLAFPMILVADEPVAADPAAATEEISPELTDGPRALSKAFRLAARKATPSVVTILSYGQQSVLERQAQARQLQQQQFQQEGLEDMIPESTESTTPPEEQLTGIGSGVIVSDDGMVITNNHVITEAKRVVVQLSDETEIEATDFRGDRDSDVGTLRIHREEGFQGAELADSDAVEIGDWVLAIGSPFRLEATVSAGIVSAKNRRLERINRGRMIQTDAAINPGNSGGPLIDLDGRVIAISTAIATRNGGYQGVGFAIPINGAKWIADQLATHAIVNRAAIGTRNAELNPKNAAKFKMPPWDGVLVYQVIAGSVAQSAGIQPLDVIIEFAGVRVRDPASLQEVLERKPIGSMQEVKVKRGGEVVTLQVQLATVEDPTGTKADKAVDAPKQQP